MRIWLVLLLLVPLASAQGPDVAILVHHPYPDDADRLGVALGDRDAFVQRHARFDPESDGYDFPMFVADGRIAIEGLPAQEGGEDRLEATTRAYEEAVQARLAEPTPIALEARSIVLDGELRMVMRANSSADLSGEDLRAWLAIVEDPVHFEPPSALSNGVFDHPFTVRHIVPLGAARLPQEFRVVVPMGDWDLDRLHIAFWIEQGGSHGSRFEPGEVVQAVFHEATDEVTFQTQRAVLVEAYSASWCDPCLFGDRALEALAEAHGVPVDRSTAAPASYWRAPPAHVWPLLAAAFALAALVRLPEARK